MEKHGNMVSLNRTRSNAKIEKAVTAIHKLLSNDEQVVVCTLVKKTGLSRAFFYNNEMVRMELNRAQEIQQGKSFVAPQKVIINKAMDKEIEMLKNKMDEKEAKIMAQQKEIIKLKKALENQALKALEEL